MFGRAAAQAFGTAAFFALLYFSVEPFVRRRISELLIGWARVLEGRFRDPRVGRDLLVGGLVGCVTGVIFHVTTRSRPGSR